MELPIPLILDGGLSNQLQAQGVVLNHPLWTAKSLVDEPEKIVAAHRTYLESGAQCLITSSYQASVAGFMSLGFSRDKALALLQKTVSLAQQAVREYAADTGDTERKFIAASIGPYGATLADGSEYRGDYTISDQELRTFHLERLNALKSAGQDFFACETIPSRQEALVLAQVLEAFDTPAWVSFSCKDAAHICDGTPLQEICQLLKNTPQIFALGVNCSAPKYISDLVRIIKKECPEKKIVIYPNSGDTYDPCSKTWHACETPLEFSKQAQVWLKEGVDIIGGCCTINPAHIKQLADKLRHDKVHQIEPA